ncbi:MAG: aminotransferase class III-fold pyridoxal phosphate-dependent enzyme [Fimbriimonadaceae bacterium]
MAIVGDFLLPVYPRSPVTLDRAQGAWLYTADGRRILDMYGGHAVSALGHGHPDLVRAVSDSFAGLDFYSNSVEMPIQKEAARRVLNDSPHLAHVHFVNSGTEANEAAIHVARRLTGRRTVVSFDLSFHGRTLASLSATGLTSYQKRLSLPPAPELHRFVRFGDGGDLDKIDGTVAAVICESVPSLGGIYMPPDGYYPALEARCREVGAYLIFDEVQGGIGRLGRWFAHERFGVRPDMVTLAKSLGGGYPVGAMLATAPIGAAMTAGEVGTTFGGGPTACRMIATVHEVIHRDGLMERTGRIFARISEGLAGIDGVAVRGAGCLIGVQTPRPASEVQRALLERDVMVGTSNQPHTIRLLPPYILADEEVDFFVRAFREAFEVSHA